MHGKNSLVFMHYGNEKKHKIRKSQVLVVKIDTLKFSAKKQTLKQRSSKKKIELKLCRY